MRASDAHHHLSSSNIIPFEKLELLFKGTKEAGANRGTEMVGRLYHDLLSELASITEYQWRSGAARGLVKGFVGPQGMGREVTVIADQSVRAGKNWVTGANKPDAHVTGSNEGRDFRVDRWEDVARVRDGDGYRQVHADEVPGPRDADGLEHDCVPNRHREG